uniref:Uncharacterized protein n=1 Tax=Romanomermis culicivorax TaxID=13658 RepID=A0A915IRF3_ROMCU
MLESNRENFQQNSFFAGKNFDRLDFKAIDRRAEEGWWHLYPFGEKYYDMDMALKPWKNLQIDLEFYFPYCGFRFNYTFIYPEGFVAFDRPHYVQPPFNFPNPRWPQDPDPSFVAAFLMEQSFAHIGERRLSHVWYRVVSRPQFRFRMPELRKQAAGDVFGTGGDRSEA